MSKGDWRRPAQVPPKDYAKEWDRIFGQKQEPPKEADERPEHA